ncbi:Hpt domain-containing protein [Alcanivorax sp. 24]|uniref:Hpt domain-containing protein n=1 Tax=Alcanivorax sp. 24 TaxID=2545266 RepID=UPI00105EA86C|nr:Hpt domain-containing protein [Alcanivorax sp. 24]
MSDHHDYLALDWVRGEIQETLDQAREALEAYVENPGDSTRMRFCQTHLHQVHGTLQMVEFYGAALLAEEMEKLARALLDRRIDQEAESLELLMRAILQLPPYLDRVASNRRDLPVVLLPLLNDLRAARGEPLLSETALFKPDLSHARGDGRIDESIRNDARFPQLIRKMRQTFQVALVGIMRGDQVKRNLGYLRRVLEKLRQISGDAARAPLWGIADAMVEGLEEDVIPLGSSAKQMLGQLDRTLRELAADGADSLERPAPTELIKNLLYYVARAERATPAIDAIRRRFRLREALPPEALVNEERARLNGPDAATLHSVVTALSEEITKVKDHLERFVHAPRSDPADLAPLVGTLKQVSDTIAMLGLGQPRVLVDEQRRVLDDIAERRQPPQRERLMDVAGALLYVEATLAGFGGNNPRRPAGNTLESTNASPLPDHIGQAMEAALRECRAGLEEAKDGVVEFIASHWDRAHLQSVPDRLQTVRGGLEMVQLQRPALVLRQCARFIRERLLDDEQAPDWQSMDTLADAMSSVEYYLERLSDDPHTGDDVLEVAHRSIAALGYPLQPEENHAEPPSSTTEAAPEPPYADDDDLVDDEIVEIFVEEADEVIEALDQYFPRWAANTGDETALVEFRRAFHTLKGSGRMVGATTVGELAWAIENMMNRVIDHSISADATLIGLVREVHALIPDLVGAFAQRQPDPVDVTPLIEAAGILADGGSLDQVPSAGGAQGKEEARKAGTRPSVTLSDEDYQALTGNAKMDPAETSDDTLDDLDSLILPDASVDQPDPVLLDIFLREAERNLALLAQWLDALDPELSEQDLDDRVHRALHTLKGSARMAELTAMAELAEAGEKLVKELIAAGLRASRDQVALIRDSHQQLGDTLRRLATQGDASLPDAGSLLNALDDARHQIRGDHHDNNAQVLSMLLSDSMDLVMDADTLLQAWSTDPEQIRPLARLRDDLQNLAQGARKAGLEEIEGLALALANTYATITQGRLIFHPELLAQLNEGHDALINMLDCLAAGQTVRAELGLVDGLRDLTETRRAGSPAPQAATIPASEQNAGLLRQAEEILLRANEHLATWQLGQPASLDQLDQEFTELATSAGKAEVPALADLAGSLARLYRRLASPETAAPTPSVFDILQRAHHRLADMIDQLRSGSLPSTDTILEEMLALADTPWTPPVETGAKKQPAVREAPPEPAARPAVVERDAELVGIFLEEAEDILHSCTESLEQWIAEPENILLVQALQRDLHTLKGGARMAELRELGDLGHEMETLYERLALGRVERRPAVFDLLHRCHDRVAEMIDQVTARRALAPARDLLQAIHDYLTDPSAFRLASPAPEISPQVPADQPTTPPGDNRDTGGIDPDILDIFLEESEELGETIEVTLTAWRDQPEDRQLNDQLKRALHTLKGGARLAGVVPLGDLSHDFEQFLERLDSQRRAPEEDDFLTMLGWLDAINQQRGQLRGQPADTRAPDTLPEPGTAAEPPATAPAAPQEMVRVSAEVLEALVNLAGETSINRGRVEQSLNDFVSHVSEIGATVTRLYEQLRRLDAETEAQILSNYQQGVDRGEFDARFDPLEMDQYSELHQITKQLSESASDLLDLKNTLLERTRDSETLLLQQQRINTELQEKLMRTRMVPFSRLVPRLRRIIRQVSGEVGKKVDFEVINPEGELDRTLMERMVAPLEHMLRNAIDHGIESPRERRAASKNETGQVRLELTREGGEVVLTLADDGGGINTEAVRAKAVERGLVAADANPGDQDVHQFIFHAGFSTASQVTQLSGRGVGMDVVASEIKQLGGTVHIESRRGQGTRFVVRLPFTLAVNRALMVRANDDTYAIPLNQIEGIVRVSPFELLDYVENQNLVYRYAGQDYDLHYLGRFVHDLPMPHPDVQSQPLPLLLIRGSDHAVALVVDNLVGSREVVVKSLGPQLTSVAGISGATILGDGSVVVILDIHSLIRAAQLRQPAPLTAPADQRDTAREQAPLVMVVDDSVTVRKVTGRLLERQGYRVITAKDGLDAIAKLEDHTPDAMLLDIEMPRMDGFEVASHVRHDARLARVPIIMITSRTGEKHRDRAFDIGVNGYMGKPFQEGELLTTLGELLEESRESVG